MYTMVRTRSPTYNGCGCSIPLSLPYPSAVHVRVPRMGVLSVYAESRPPSCRDLVMRVSGNILTKETPPDCSRDARCHEFAEMPGCGSLPMGAPPLWCRAGRLHLDAVARTIGVPSNQAPAITAGVMHPLADLLVVDIQRTVTVWTRDDHPLLAFTHTASQQKVCHKEAPPPRASPRAARVCLRSRA